jgi:hypothetical protein
MTIISAAGKTKLPNFGRPSRSSVTNISLATQITMPNSRRPNHGGTTTASGVQEIPLIPEHRTTVL